MAASLRSFARVAVIQTRFAPALHRVPSIQSHISTKALRIHTSAVRKGALDDAGGLTNILEDESIPIRVANVSKEEIVLADGLVLPPNCLFLNGHIFTWNTPVVKMMEVMPNGRGWEAWTDDIWTIFETVTPRPELLIIGTGDTVLPVPPSIRSFLNSLGIQLDVQSTRNACSTYNLLSEEGRRVSAAFVRVE
ncbi:hypothetical protein MCUN1_003845 [Malassezia cuniculi]|uniref:NADH dehydrogenase [ubiquinone] 1 alpha subcomplex assembly factor 3 n=1 Tax=Malassezia cuniculi TaxID=948313 RepID=A0AAF0F2C4_9BASI|nr:hypothetical protein MCUN1_003845 [Malassezia cuniculi]